MTDAAILLESDGQGALVLSSLPLTTTESGPHSARSRPSAHCNHTATRLGDTLYVYGGTAAWSCMVMVKPLVLAPPYGRAGPLRLEAYLTLAHGSRHTSYI